MGRSVRYMQCTCGLTNISCQLLLGSSLEVAANLFCQDCTAARGVKLGEVDRQRLGCFYSAVDEGSSLVGCDAVWLANGCPHVSHEGAGV